MIEITPFDSKAGLFTPETAQKSSEKFIPFPPVNQWIQESATHHPEHAKALVERILEHDLAKGIALLSLLFPDQKNASQRDQYFATLFSEHVVRKNPEFFIQLNEDLEANEPRDKSRKPTITLYRNQLVGILSTINSTSQDIASKTDSQQHPHLTTIDEYYVQFVRNSEVTVAPPDNWQDVYGNRQGYTPVWDTTIDHAVSSAYFSQHKPLGQESVLLRTSLSAARAELENVFTSLAGPDGNVDQFFTDDGLVDMHRIKNVRFSSFRHDFNIHEVLGPDASDIESTEDNLGPGYRFHFSREGKKLIWSDGVELPADKLLDFKRFGDYYSAWYERAGQYYISLNGQEFSIGEVSPARIAPTVYLYPNFAMFYDGGAFFLHKDGTILSYPSYTYENDIFGYFLRRGWDDQAVFVPIPQPPEYQSQQPLTIKLPDGLNSCMYYTVNGHPYVMADYTNGQQKQSMLIELRHGKTYPQATDKKLIFNHEHPELFWIPERNVYIQPHLSSEFPPHQVVDISAQADDDETELAKDDLVHDDLQPYEDENFSDVHVMVALSSTNTNKFFFDGKLIYKTENVVEDYFISPDKQLFTLETSYNSTPSFAGRLFLNGKSFSPTKRFTFRHQFINGLPLFHSEDINNVFEMWLGDNYLGLYNESYDHETGKARQFDFTQQPETPAVSKKFYTALEKYNTVLQWRDLANRLRSLQKKAAFDENDDELNNQIVELEVTLEDLEQRIRNFYGPAIELSRTHHFLVEQIFEENPEKKLDLFTAIPLQGNEKLSQAIIDRWYPVDQSKEKIFSHLQLSLDNLLPAIRELLSRKRSGLTADHVFQVKSERESFIGGDAEQARKEKPIGSVTPAGKSGLMIRLKGSSGDTGVWESIPLQKLDGQVTQESAHYMVKVPPKKEPIIYIIPLQFNGILNKDSVALTIRGEKIKVQPDEIDQENGYYSITLPPNTTQIEYSDHKVTQTLISNSWSQLETFSESLTSSFPHYEELLHSPLQIHPQLKLQLHALRDSSSSPLEFLCVAEVLCRNIGFYDNKNSETLTDRENLTPQQALFFANERANTLKISDHKDKPALEHLYAGVCYESALLLIAMLRETGFYAGLVSELRLDQKGAFSAAGHGSVFVLWPAQNDVGYQVIYLDGTFDNTTSPSVRTHESLADRLHHHQVEIDGIAKEEDEFPDQSWKKPASKKEKLPRLSDSSGNDDDSTESVLWDKEVIINTPKVPRHESQRNNALFNSLLSELDEVNHSQLAKMYSASQVIKYSGLYPELDTQLHSSTEPQIMLEQLTAFSEELDQSDLNTALSREEMMYQVADFLSTQS